ncbi:MAG: T9SS type A sorting domain-containing protein [Bacteroidetes bacterium]|nr:T9SS type A sorting domain-containing protein [Bacteroidota bacterium]
MKKLLVSLFAILLFSNTSWSQCETWTNMPDFPGEARKRPIAFSIGSNGYLFMGDSDNGYKYDAWKFMQDSNKWVQIAAFPGKVRVWASVFVIDTSAYMVGGTAGDRLKDVWRFDAPSEKWTQLADYPGGEIGFSVAFAINGKGYVGTGASKSDSYKGRSDFYEYNPTTNSWKQVANMPGPTRVNGIGFSDGTYGYAGLGTSSGSFNNDFYRYDPSNDKWSKMANGPYAYYTQSMFVNGKGIVPLGRLTGNRGVYEYDVSNNRWNQLPNIESSRHMMGAFAIGNFGYLCVGSSYNAPDYTTVFRYNALAKDIVIKGIAQQDPFCHNEHNGRISLDIALERNYYRFSIDNGTNYLDSGVFANLPAGFYTIMVDDTVGCSKSTDTIELINPASPDSSYAIEICDGDSLQFGTRYLNEAGMFTDSFSNMKGCDSLFSVNLTVLEKPSPKVDAPTINERNVKTKITNLQEGESITWFTGDGAKLVDFIEFDHTYKENGIFDLCAVVSNNCFVDSVCFSVSVKNSGVSILAKNQTSVYPNPTSGWVNIEMPIEAKHQIMIYNLQGQVLETISATNTQNLPVDLSAYAGQLLLIEIGQEKHLVRVE